MDDLAPFEKLVAIMDRLREPDGCPWDREQSYETLRGYLIEECYEAAEALDNGDIDGLREELGDLLFQIIFLARLAKEQRRFTIDDVLRGIAEKMIRRHPHVFGEERVDSSEEVLVNWELIKREEKRQRSGVQAASALDGIPRALPALLRALRLGEKAARVGFDWEHPADILGKFEEEQGELRQALERGRTEEIREEIGDLLFTLAMLARRLQIDPEQALEATNIKFRHRFAWVESELERRGVALRDAGIEELERLWQQAKQRLDRG
jgi:tetrapyrrole methylase family protein/MazG family protein